MKGLTTWGLSPGATRWKYNKREDALYLRLDGKTPGALLYPDIEFWNWMRSVGGRLWVPLFGAEGAVNETPLFQVLNPNFAPHLRSEFTQKNTERNTKLYRKISVLICVIATSGSEERKTVSGGQFKWGTFLLKSNGEVQRSANSGWKSEWSRKGKSRLYCETDMSSSWETRT